MIARAFGTKLPVPGAPEIAGLRGAALGTDGGYFAMSFGPSAAVVGLIRRFAEDFYSEVLGQSDASSRVALATHELLENAVQYCNPPEIAIRGSITPSTHGFYVTVRTRNRSTPDHCRELQRIVAELDSVTDTAAYIQKLLKESTQNGRPLTLGLARVRAEAEMQLSYEIVDNEITVVASANINRTSSRIP